jgi:hypothetical protein
MNEDLDCSKDILKDSKDKFISMTTIKPNIDFEKGIIEFDCKNIFNDIVTNHYKEIINTKEEFVKKALIALGWTPPNENNVTGPIITKTCEWSIKRKGNYITTYHSHCNNGEQINYYEQPTKDEFPKICPYCKNKIVVI